MSSLLDYCRKVIYNIMKRKEVIVCPEDLVNNAAITYMTRNMTIISVLSILMRTKWKDI